jgi:16S rRNA (cytosine1402-N4)-methyltransferase
MEFKHLPVLLNECLDGLNIKSSGIYVDGTLGGGGHSYEILKRLKKGFLVGIDKDDDAIKAASERLNTLNKKFVAVKSDFKNYRQILNNLNIEKVDGVLLDLGVSSFQLDNALRGFSYNQNAPLDMRMDTSNPLTAEKVVNS